MTETEIYCRVVDADGYRGTVLYIGPVAISKSKDEVWFGIKWDKAERGKHDGCCVDENGITHRYFDSPNNSGSFVKRNKVTFGISMSEALQKRYVSLDAPEITTDCILPDAFVMTSKGNQRSIELVGEKQIRKWQQIDVVDKVSLRCENISTIGSDIAQLAGRFKEIDLQDNLIYKWSEISMLAVQLPNLKSLLLHGNKFEPLTLSIVESLSSNSLDRINVLALNSCNINSWESIELLSTLLPNIEELYLAGNNFSDMPYYRQSSVSDDKSLNQTDDFVIVNAEEREFRGFSSIRILDICGCDIKDWRQVLYLRSLPVLQELIVDSNPFQNVLPVPSDSTFSNLIRISLSATKLESWGDVDAISTYSSIRQLRLSQIPLFSGKGASEVRPKVIARIKQLAFFNGSGISPRERVDAEKAYLRSIMRDIDNRIDNISSIHPRYEELSSLYSNELLPLGKVNESLSFAADMITITFRNMSFSSGGTLEPIVKKIPSSMSIARLHMMVKQLIGLEIRAQLLSLRIYKDSVPTLLDDEQSTLQYYGAIDGAEIFINETK